MKLPEVGDLWFYPKYGICVIEAKTKEKNRKWYYHVRWFNPKPYAKKHDIYISDSFTNVLWKKIA